MRQIKFRAWRIQAKEMYSVTDDLCLIDGKVGWLQDGWDLVDELDDPVMQYTGVNDMNGKEIYEGDILHGVKNKAKYVVKFGEYSYVEWHCGFYLDRDNNGKLNEGMGHTNENLEVIGNIYENPELLKGVDNNG